MAAGAAKKSPKPSHGGLVTSAPISSIKALRSLEAGYVRQGAELDKAYAEIKRLASELKKQRGE